MSYQNYTTESPGHVDSHPPYLFEAHAIKRMVNKLIPSNFRHDPHKKATCINKITSGKNLSRACKLRTGDPYIKAELACIIAYLHGYDSSLVLVHGQASGKVENVFCMIKYTTPEETVYCIDPWNNLACPEPYYFPTLKHVTGGSEGKYSSLHCKKIMRYIPSLCTALLADELLSLHFN